MLEQQLYMFQFPIRDVIKFLMVDAARTARTEHKALLSLTSKANCLC